MDAHSPTGSGYSSQTNDDDEPLECLPAGPRRVLGVLIEKGYTTPDQYPLTLKALTTGCNQKNNRDPLTSLSEEECEEFLEVLREENLIASVHTDGGRAERFRHLFRKRMAISESQLAILGELLLRGRQQVGELRSRASRMVAIESLEDLRDQLRGLIEKGLVQASGPLERRGAEVDHALHEESEGQRLAYSETESVASASTSASKPPVATRPPQQSQAASGANAADLETLQRQYRELVVEMAELKNEVTSLTDVVSDLRRQLGA